MKSIIGLFADDEIAAAAAQDLIARGITREDIVVVAPPSATDYPCRFSTELSNRGVPEDRRAYYLEAVRRGGALVVVDSRDELAEDVATIVDHRGTIDVDRAV